MFSSVIDFMKTAISACFTWAADLFSSVSGSLGFIIFFILLSSFIIRVLPMIVNGGKRGSDRYNGKSKSKDGD